MKKLICVLLFSTATMLLFGQNKRLFSIQPSDTVGLLTYNKKVFTGTKEQLIAINKQSGYFLEPQPKQSNIIILSTWNDIVPFFTRGMFVQTKNGWERVVILTIEAVRDIALAIDTDGTMLLRYIPVFEDNNGTWYPADFKIEYYRTRKGWQTAFEVQKQRNG